MRRPIPTCAGILLSALLSFSVLTSSAVAEFELDVDGGFWIPFLPDYTAGSIVQGGVAQQRDLFRDDQTDLGTQLGLSGYYRAPGASHRIEYDLDLAGIGSMGSTATFPDPTPGTVWWASLDGFGFISTAAGEPATFTLDSDVLYNSQYVGLASTQFMHGRSNRPIDLGIGFRHMGFEQEFNLTAVFQNQNGQYLEDLDTDYLGGEVRGSLSCPHNGRDWFLDFGVGFFNMNAQYEGQSYLRNNVGGAVVDFDSMQDEIDEFAVSVDLALRVDTQIRGVGVRPGVTFQYISDMPFINHPMTEVPNSDPVFLSTKSGYFLGVNVEMFLWCGCNLR